MEEKDEAGNGAITQHSLAVPTDALTPNEDSIETGKSPTSIRHILRTAAERHKGNMSFKRGSNQFTCV